MAVSTIFEGDANANKTDANRQPAQGGVGLLCFQLVSKGLNAADASFSLQQTNEPDDPTSWIDTADSSILVSSGDDSNMIVVDMSRGGAAFFRFVYNAGSNTSGTIKVILSR